MVDEVRADELMSIYKKQIELEDVSAWSSTSNESYAAFVREVRPSNEDIWVFFPIKVIKNRPARYANFPAWRIDSPDPASNTSLMATALVP